MNTQRSKLPGTDNKTSDMRTISDIYKLFPLPAGEGQGEGNQANSSRPWFHVALLLSLLAMQCLAQPQEAWIARYNGGFSNKTHTPLAMALDSMGNIYIAGSSQNVSGDNDYVVLKYAPNGMQLFASRYDSTNGANDTVKGFALDKNGNSLVTGTGGTVKFDDIGAVAWTAAYSGNDVAVDTNGKVYVTGFSTNDFATVKLSPNGSNVWVRMYDKIGKRDESQKVAVDNAGNVYVAGWETWQEYYIGGQPDPYYYYQAAMLKYDASGSTTWTNDGYLNELAPVETKGLIPDNQGNVYVAANVAVGGTAFTVKVSTDGQQVWGFSAGPSAAAMSLDTNESIYLTGLRLQGGGATSYRALKLDTKGQPVWERVYYPTAARHAADAIALDSVGNVYVTGVSTNTTTHNDFATLKYDNDGNQQWVKRYNGPANGDDGAMAIAVAPDGSIYVTGYSANTNGGVDITTIKYGSLDNIQKKSNGDIQLQFFGTPGQSYGLQGTTNFQFWDELGSSIADTNGIFEFLDTNAPLFPHRFYRWHYP